MYLLVPKIIISTLQESLVREIYLFLQISIQKSSENFSRWVMSGDNNVKFNK